MHKHIWKGKMSKQTSESERRMFTAPTPRVDNGEVMNTFGKKVCNCKAAKLQSCKGFLSHNHHLTPRAPGQTKQFSL
jgi:hypothetical protein